MCAGAKSGNRSTIDPSAISFFVAGVEGGQVSCARARSLVALHEQPGRFDVFECGAREDTWRAHDVPQHAHRAEDGCKVGCVKGTTEHTGHTETTTTTAVDYD